MHTKPRVSVCHVHSVLYFMTSYAPDKGYILLLAFGFARYDIMRTTHGYIWLRAFDFVRHDVVHTKQGEQFVTCIRLCTS